MSLLRMPFAGDISTSGRALPTLIVNDARMNSFMAASDALLLMALRRYVRPQSGWFSVREIRQLCVTV